MNKNKFFCLLTAVVLTLTACSSKSQMTSGCIDIDCPDTDIAANTDYIKATKISPIVITQAVKEESSSLESSSVSSANSSKDISSNSPKKENSSKPEVIFSQSSSEKSEENSSKISSKPTQSNSSSSKIEENSSEETEEKPTESSSEPQSSSQSSDFEENNYITTIPNGELRAVWISYLEFNNILKGKSEGEFRTNIKTMFSNISDMGLNTVIVHVRPFSDALYYSDIFPISHIVTGTEGMDAGFDPLEIMIDYAHSYNLRLEAWINPYRIRNSGTKAEISADSPMYSLGKNAVYKYSGGICYNPGSKEAQKLIIDGVKEIVSNYDVDGIHFDDYFYASTDPSIDAETYSQYKKSGGKLSLADYRRKNVDDLVKAVYSAIKSINPNVSFGISPQGNMDINYNSQYIDVEKWLSTKGFVDYICPQLYYGFDNKECPFKETVEEWNNMICADGVKLYVGISAYKIGCEDKWAGEKGIHEWENCGNMLKRMVMTARGCSNYNGFFLYRYDSLFNPPASLKNHVNQEIKNLKSII